MTNTRAKFAFLTYDSMLEKIADGTLNQLDIIYTKDSHENVIISPDLIPITVRSRIYTFDSVSEANEKLNINTDTYKGQIIAILNNDKYRAYIVNQDENGIYYTTPLSEDNIDYNTLGNRPIENLVGTLDNPILITALTPGVYKVKGQYKIIETEETVYLSVSGDLFLIEISDDGKLIKHFTKDTIQDYVISGNDITKKTYITDKYLLDNGYTTTAYVDIKVAALEEEIKTDVKSYVEQIIEEVITEKVDELIDERLDVKLDEKIQAIPTEKVIGLF